MSKTGRIVNFRLPFAAALALACGVAAAYLFTRYLVDYFYLIAVVPVAAVIFIVLLLVTRGKRAIVFFFITLAFFALGAIYAAVIFSSLISPPAVADGFATVEGVVEEVRATSTGEPYLVISSPTVNGLHVGGKMLVYLGEEAGGALSPGYKVSLYGYVGHYDLIAYGSLNYRVIGGASYYASAYGALQYSYGFSLFGTLRSAIYATLFDNLDYETAAVAYAMITGSTQDISSGTLEAFRFGGVAHIFAVSGLNITVLYVAVSALLKKLRANKWLSAAVSLLVIFFYTGMCGFTLSAVRAAIMCAVAALSSLTFNKYDGLNSLSLAVIIILLINPLNLFDVGFVLSVSAMLGIIFLSSGINRALRRLPSGLRSNISMSVASQAATFPALMLTFGYISGAGLLLNIVVLPLLTLLYIILFACTALCCVIPAIAPAVLPVAALPLQAVVNFLVGGGFERSLISGFGGWWVALFAAIAIAALSDKFNFSLTIRAAVGGVCAVCFALCCTLGGAVFGNETRIVAGGYYGGGMVLVRAQSGTTLILICDTYSGGISSFVNTYAPEGVDDLIILGGEDCAAYYYECGVNVQRVWLAPSNIQLGGLDGAEVFYEESFELYGTYYAFNNSFTLSAETSGVTFLVGAGENVDADPVDLALLADGNAVADAANIVYFNSSGGHFNLYTQGCLQFIANGGKLMLQGSVPPA